MIDQPDQQKELKLGLANFIKNLRIYKVLIGGAETSQRRTVRNLLMSLGLSNLREAGDGDEALRKLRAEEFNFVICQLEMPIKDGLEVVRTMRTDQHLADLPFIMLLSRGDNLILGWKMKPNLDGCLKLPILPQTLEDKMVEILLANIKPTIFDLKLQTAGAYLTQGVYDRALKELDQAGELNPYIPLVDYFRQKVYEAKGQFDKAEEARRQARKNFAKAVNGPKMAEHGISSGRDLLSQGRVDEARLVFKEAIEFDPENPKWVNEIGEAYLAQGLAEEAESWFSALLVINPEDIYLYNRLGMALRRQKKFKEAIAVYEKALSLDNHEENLRYNLARAYLSSGDREGAIRCLQMAIELFPEFKEAKTLLMKISSA